MHRAVCALALGTLLLGAAPALAIEPPGARPSLPGAAEAPSAVPPRLSEREAVASLLAVPKVAGWLERYPPHPQTAAELDPVRRRWTVHVWSGRAGEVARGTVVDLTGEVLEAWTGPQVAWRMARGERGAFGGRTLARWPVWGALCAIFAIGLVDPRRLRSLRTLDVVALLAFTVSLAFFDRGQVFRSVPLAYPPLAYLLARTLWIGLRGRRDPAPRVAWPALALLAAAVFLAGFRIGLNVREHRGVIDVGYAGVIGADRLLHGQAPYGHMPVEGSLRPCGPADASGEIRLRVQTNGRCESANPFGDTYGPAAYLAYVPAVAAFGWSGRWDTLPAAHAAAIAFDLLAAIGLGLVGLRFGGRALAALLVFAWEAYPFTAYALVSSTNDALMPALLVWGFWLCTSPWARGAAVAAAGWTKFAALAAAPLWLGYRLSPGAVLRAAAAFALATVALFSVLLLEPSLSGAVRAFWHRTLGFQISRDSPFSLWDWGQYRARGIPDLHALQVVLEVGVLVLSAVLAFVPRRKGPLELAALTAALLAAVQLVLTHWFYLYLPWLLPFALLALLLPRTSRAPA